MKIQVDTDKQICVDLEASLKQELAKTFEEIKLKDEEITNKNEQIVKMDSKIQVLQALNGRLHDQLSLSEKEVENLERLLKEAKKKIAAFEQVEADAELERRRKQAEADAELERRRKQAEADAE